jgi:hypothetical protein
VYKRSASTGSVGTPKFPGVSSPSVNLNRTVEVALKGTWGASSVALSPVDLVDLPEADIESVVGVVKHGVGVSSTFVRNDALAASLVPIVLGAPSCNIGHVFGGTAWAAWASSTWAVTSTGVSHGEGEDETDENDEFHG